MSSNIATQKPTALDEELAALKAQVARAKRRRRSDAPGDSYPQTPVTSVGAVSAPTTENASQPSAQSGDTTETERAARVRLITAWIAGDPAFIEILVGALTQAIKPLIGSSDRKTLRVNIMLSTIFLIAGWLLSTVTPILFNALLRR